MPGWEGSNRREQLPADWKDRREKVIERDRGVCQWRSSDGAAYIRDADGDTVWICGAPGNQVDHIVRGANHHLDNLQLLCEPHHLRKSAAEGGNSYVPLRRPADRHPGLA